MSWYQIIGMCVLAFGLTVEMNQIKERLDILENRRK